MAESFVNVTEGSGKKLHTFQRVIGANTVEDEAVFSAEFPYASYVAGPTGSVSIGTANDHVLTLNAGASLNVRIRRIHLEQGNNAGTAAFTPFEIWRTTTAAPTGGTGVTPAPFDTTDAASGAAARTLPTAKGTESTLLFRPVLVFRSAASASGTAEDAWEWVQHPGQKPIIIPAGTTNGIAIKVITAIASATVVPWIEFIETNF